MPLVIQLPFGMSVDLSFWATILSWPTWDIIRFVFAVGGWAVLALIFFYMASVLWADYRNSKYTADWKWVILAVDIPEELVQSPKAVEQMFSHLSGALESVDVVDKYWKGKSQKWFSLEIISLEGYIQFLIRTEEEFRDLVEASVYAQYPAAEITEVDDYVDSLQDNFPNEEQDMFGLEFGLVQEEFYPIRTYPYFEHSISKDSVFHDPMGSLLENFSRIGAGENLWMQILIKPVNSNWKEQGIELAKKLFSPVGASKKSGLVDMVTGIPMKVVQEAVHVLEWNFEAGEEASAKEPEKINLTPGMKTVVEAIEEKVSKVGFKTKIRILQSAKTPVFNPSKCVNGFVGSLNQFFNTSQNGIQPVIKATSKKKGNIFIKAFKKRKLGVGKSPYILNIEELATIWHFPLAFVKTPLIQKTASKRAEPPTGLTLESGMDLPFEDEKEILSKSEIITDASGEIKTESAYTPDSDNNDDNNIKKDDSKFDKNLPYG